MTQNIYKIYFHSPETVPQKNQRIQNAKCVFDHFEGLLFWESTVAFNAMSNFKRLGAGDGLHNSALMSATHYDYAIHWYSSDFFESIFPSCEKYITHRQNRGDALTL